MKDDQTATRPLDSGSAEPRVVVVWDGGTLTRPLPREGSLTIGRAQTCDVCIDHVSVSRKHAVLHVGSGLRLEDLGSANGTKVQGTRIPSGGTAAFATSQLVEIGAAILRVEYADFTDTSRESMADVNRLIELAARGTISVLLLGETGVGKEVAATKIHRDSPRRDKPFVRINCAALTSTLLESELFGHERGAFTGALTAKAGLIEAANGGTFFLDEVGDLPLPTQAKLLRVLEAREVTRVGGLQARPIDVRFVSATNRDLRALCASGEFRTDLVHRLDGIRIKIPSLRERRDEIPELARSFVARTAADLGREPPAIGDEAMAKLMAHSWPGNVRELRNALERAVLMSTSAVIAAADLRLEIEPDAGPPASRPSSLQMPPPSVPGDLRTDLAAHERARIVAALADHGGNQTKAARALGISRRTLLNRMATYGLPRPRKPT